MSIIFSHHLVNLYFDSLNVSLSPHVLSLILYQVKSDIERWDNLPLSLIGRIGVVKMNILPYFFSYTFVKVTEDSN